MDRRRPDCQYPDFEMTVSGGIHAIRGFNYQDTVILDILMTHFQEHGASSSVRPEGIDDLELTWIAPGGAVQKRFVQVKKPREDAATKPTDSPWSLGEVTRELIPGTLGRLEGNSWKQHWILGDALHEGRSQSCRGRKQRSDTCASSVLADGALFGTKSGRRRRGPRK